MTTRQPITLVEIFQPDGVVLRLAESVEGIPMEWDAIPSIASVRTKPAKLNFAGLNKTSSSLGVRAAVTITLQDHADGPQGTFWGKWIAVSGAWSEPQTFELVDELGRAIVISEDGGAETTLGVEFVLTALEDASGYQNLRVDVIEGDLTDSPEIGYSDDFSRDSSADDWVGGFETVDGTLDVTDGALKLTKGAGDGARPRYVREIATVVGTEYRVHVPAATGTADKAEAYVSTAADGGSGGAVTTVADNAALDEPFVATTELVYAVIRAGTGSAAGETVILDSFEVRPVRPMRRSSYFFEDIQGPTGNGKVTIKCRDILSRVKEGQPQIPSATDGTLSGDISAGATSFTIDLPGTIPNFGQYQQIGDTYGGLLYIGDEVMRFTGATETASTITFIGVVRGQYGTTAESHDDEEKVQFGHEWIDEKPWRILRDILVNWADVPEEWIPLEEWEAEGGVWLLPYADMTGAIVDPMDVEDAISELLESIVASIWVDVAAQKIRLRATRPITEIIVPVSDEDILLNSQNPEIRIDEQVSSAAIYYNVRDLAEDIDDISNFNSVNVRAGRQIGRPRNRTIFSRWIGTNAQADQTLQTILAASNELPTYVSFTLGLSKSELKIGDVVRLRTRVVQTRAGAIRSKLYFVIESQQNHRAQTQDITLRSLGQFLTKVYFYAPATGVPDWDSADATEREENAFYADDVGELGGAPSEYRLG